MRIFSLVLPSESLCDPSGLTFMMDATCSYFQIGAVAIKITSEVPEVFQDYMALYGAFRSPNPLCDCLEFEVLCQKKRPWSKPDYIIKCEGRDFVAGQDINAVLPELEAAINRQVIRRRKDFVQFHAGVMSFEGQGVLLPAFSGTGKTTLTAALIQRGWQYLSDEFALIDPNTLLVHPFPKSLCIKKSGLPLISSMGVPIFRDNIFRYRSEHSQAYVNPLAVRPDSIGSPCSIQWVFFLSRNDDAAGRLRAVSDADAAMYLYSMGLTVGGRRHEGLKVTMALIRQSQCYVLRRDDIEQTCDFLESVLIDGPDETKIDRRSADELLIAAGQPPPFSQMDAERLSDDPINR